MREDEESKQNNRFQMNELFLRLEVLVLKKSTVCKFANFSPTMIFCINSDKSTFSLKSYTVNQFDEKILQWGKFLKLPQHGKTRNSLTATHKFFSSKQFTVKLF